MFKNFILPVIAILWPLLLNGKTDAIEIKEEGNIYDKVFDAPLFIAGEQSLALHDLYSRKPLILALIFTRCSGVCSPFLQRLKENLQFKTQDDPYTILVLSFDPRDSAKDMELLAKRFSLENNKKWIFAITDSISQLNQSIGFEPVWKSERMQYDHDALLVGINSDGYITKKLIGVRHGHDLDLLIASVNNIFSPTYRLPNVNTLFSCFNYDPKTGENRLGWGLIFVALPAVITTILLISISYLVFKKPIKNVILRP